MKKTMLLSALLAGTALFAADQAAATPAPAAKAAAVAPAAQPAAAPAKAVAPAAQPAAAQPAKKDDSPNFALCMSRGLCNICTGWLEIPRCMIYDNGFMPFFGLIIGIPEGAVFTVARELCGVFDIVSFGMSGNACHGEVFPHTIFQSKWIYKK